MKKLAKCERTGELIPVERGFFVGRTRDGSWEFVSYQAQEYLGDYPILSTDLVANPSELVDWMAHLYEKAWFKPWKFFRFMHEFRRDNRLY